MLRFVPELGHSPSGPSSVSLETKGLRGYSEKGHRVWVKLSQVIPRVTLPINEGWTRSPETVQYALLATGERGRPWKTHHPGSVQDNDTLNVVTVYHESWAMDSGSRVLSGGCNSYEVTGDGEGQGVGEELPAAAPACQCSAATSIRMQSVRDDSTLEKWRW